MTNEEKAREMAEEYRAVLAANTDFDVNDLDLAEEDATRLILDMAEWKDQQFKEYLEENFADIIFECICEYNKLKGSLNDDGTLCSDYRLAQDINILCQAKFIHELFKKE